MSSEKGVIEREDLERLSRLLSAASALRETGYNNERAEEALACVDLYKDRFLTLSRAVTETESRHRAQQQSVKDIEGRLRQNQNDHAETKTRLKTAIEESDVDTVALLNTRLPAVRLVIDNLEQKLAEARQELATMWQLFDRARGHVLDARRQVDFDSDDLERLVGIVVFNSDPKLEQIRARHRLQSNPSDTQTG